MCSSLLYTSVAKCILILSFSITACLFGYQQLFCKSCHLLHTTQLKKNWSDVIDDLFAEKQRLCLIKQESKVSCKCCEWFHFASTRVPVCNWMNLLVQARYKKIRDNVRASVAIQMQQLSEKQEQLLVKLKLWREEEAAKFTEIQELCDQILAQTPTIGSRDEEPVPNVYVLKIINPPSLIDLQLYGFFLHIVR